MNTTYITLILADDDIDDCLLFEEALTELDAPVLLTTVHDGVELMDFLTNNPTRLPNIVFLDLNMPRKTGIDCLKEIKNSESFKELPVIIFSTSYHPDIASKLYNFGANHYIRKPNTFSSLKNVINQVLISLEQNLLCCPSENLFLIK